MSYCKNKANKVIHTPLPRVGIIKRGRLIKGYEQR